MEELYDFKNMENNEKNEKKRASLLTNKNNMFEMICKENEKLTNEINLISSQVEQYSHQINEKK